MLRKDLPSALPESEFLTLSSRKSQRKVEAPFINACTQLAQQQSPLISLEPLCRRASVSASKYVKYPPAREKDLTA